VTGLGEAVERHLDLRIGAGAVGDVGGIVGDERGIERVDVGGRRVAALRNQSPFDHRPRAPANQRARGLQRDGGQSVLREDEIERADEVGRRVNQRAVEVEDDGEHGLSPSGRAPRAQAFGP
jgi:hypothetical protein